MAKTRYLVAVVVACLFVVGGAAFCVQTRRALVEHMRQELDKPENKTAASGQAKAMLDEGILPPGMGIELPPSMEWRLYIADVLAGFWYAWVIVAFGGCLVAARFLALFERNSSDGGGGS